MRTTMSTPSTASTCHIAHSLTSNYEHHYADALKAAHPGPNGLQRFHATLHKQESTAPLHRDSFQALPFHDIWMSPPDGPPGQPEQFPSTTRYVRSVTEKLAILDSMLGFSYRLSLVLEIDYSDKTNLAGDAMELDHMGGVELLAKTMLRQCDTSQDHLHYTAESHRFRESLRPTIMSAYPIDGPLSREYAAWLAYLAYYGYGHFDCDAGLAREAMTKDTIEHGYRRFITFAYIDSSCGPWSLCCNVLRWSPQDDSWKPFITIGLVPHFTSAMSHDELDLLMRVVTAIWAEKHGEYYGIAADSKLRTPVTAEEHDELDPVLTKLRTYLERGSLFSCHS